MKYIPFFCLILASTALFSQTGDELPSEQVEVIKIFEAQLEESEKIPLSPVLPDVDTSINKQRYDVPPKIFNVEYPAPRIRPISYKSEEEIPDVYRAYAKLGAGLPSTIYGEGAFNTSIDRGGNSSYDLGLNLLHHSANLSSGDVENQRFGYTKAEGTGTYYFEEGFAVAGNLGYTADRVHYYGYNFDEFSNFTTVDKESVKQLFSIFDLGAKIFNGEQTAGDLNYSAGFDFYAMGDNFAADETAFDLKLHGTKWIQDRHAFDLGIRTDFTWYNDTMEVSQTLHNFTFSPSFTFHADVFKVKVGANLISSDDEFEIFPDIEAVLNLTGNELAFYVGVEGDLRKNTLRTLSDYNPYIHTRFPDETIRNTRYFNVYGGARGNLKFFEYTIQAGYKPTNDFALYVFNFDHVGPIYDFDVIYDDVDIINISGTLSATPIRGLTLTGTISQNIFDPKVEIKAWHLPSLEANFQALFTSNDGKLKANAQLFLQNGVATRTSIIPGRYDNLNSLFDLSMGGEYWVSDHFGAFLQLNNLLDNERFRWYYYPTYGVNVLGGITIRF